MRPVHLTCLLCASCVLTLVPTADGAPRGQRINIAVPPGATSPAGYNASPVPDPDPDGVLPADGTQTPAESSPTIEPPLFEGLGGDPSATEDLTDSPPTSPIPSPASLSPSSTPSSLPPGSPSPPPSRSHPRTPATADPPASSSANGSAVAAPSPSPSQSLGQSSGAPISRPLSPPSPPPSENTAATAPPEGPLVAALVEDLAAAAALRARPVLDIRVGTKAAVVVLKTPEGVLPSERLEFSLRRGGWFGKRAVATWEYRRRGVQPDLLMRLRHEVGRVVEYRPTTDAPDFQPGVHTKIRQLKPKRWGLFQYDISDGIHRISTTTADGRIQLSAVAQRPAANATAIGLDPNVVRLEVRVLDFPSRHPGTRLCVVADARSEMQRTLPPAAEAPENDEDPLIHEEWVRDRVPAFQSSSDQTLKVSHRRIGGGRMVRMVQHRGAYYHSLPLELPANATPPDPPADASTALLADPSTMLLLLPAVAVAVPPPHPPMSTAPATLSEPNLTAAASTPGGWAAAAAACLLTVGVAGALHTLYRRSRRRDYIFLI